MWVSALVVVLCGLLVWRGVLCGREGKSGGGGGGGGGGGPPPPPTRSSGAPLKRVNGGMVRSKTIGH
mgnify:CR=1 FL=1